MKRQTKTTIAQLIARAGVGFTAGGLAGAYLIPFCENKVQKTLTFIGATGIAAVVCDKLDDIVEETANGIYEIVDCVNDLMKD